MLRSGVYPDQWLDVGPGARCARPVLADPTGFPPALVDDLSFQLWQLGHPDFQPEGVD